jgi:hypothetical protein
MSTSNMVSHSEMCTNIPGLLESLRHSRERGGIALEKGGWMSHTWTVIPTREVPLPDLHTTVIYSECRCLK